MGAASSSASLVRGLGLATSSSSSGQDHTTTMQWNNNLSHIKQEIDHNLGLGLLCGNNNAGLSDVMMGSSDPFGGGQSMTRDLLGLGIGGGATRAGLPALLTSFGRNFQTSEEEGGGVQR